MLGLEISATGALSPSPFKDKTCKKPTIARRRTPRSTEGNDTGHHHNGRNTRTPDKSHRDKKNQGGGKKRCEILARAPAHQQIASPRERSIHSRNLAPAPKTEWKKQPPSGSKQR
jgi:hypothetical protein